MPMKSWGKKKTFHRRNLTEIIKVYQQIKPELKLHFRCCQEKKIEYYANSLTGTDETCKPVPKKSEYNSEK